MSKIAVLVTREKEEGCRARGDLIYLMNVKYYDRHGRSERINFAKTLREERNAHRGIERIEKSIGSLS
jgi:hypothetical protein